MINKGWKCIIDLIIWWSMFSVCQDYWTKFILNIHHMWHNWTFLTWKNSLFILKRKSLPQSCKPPVVWPLVTSLQPLPSLLPFLTVLQPHWLFSNSLEKLNFFPLRGLEGFNIHECLPRGVLVWPLLPQSKLDPMLHSSQHLLIPFVASPTLSKLKCLQSFVYWVSWAGVSKPEALKGPFCLVHHFISCALKAEFFPWIFMEFLGVAKGCALC